MPGIWFQEIAFHELHPLERNHGALVSPRRAHNRRPGQRRANFIAV